MKKIISIAALILLIISPRVFANQIIPGGQIEAMAKAEIENFLANRGEYRRHEIEFMRTINDVNVPNGVIDIQVTLPQNNVSYSGMTPIRARISIGGRFYRDINFTANVKIFDNVVVANHDLRIEEIVGETDFRIDEVQIDGRTEYCKDIAEVKGLVPHRYIRAGSPVAKSYFQQPVVINSGAAVRIIVKRNGMEVSAKGVAMSRGRIGQVIKVKNESSQKILSATIIDAQTVEVVF